MSAYGTANAVATYPTAPPNRVTHLDRLTQILSDGAKLVSKLNTIEQTLSPQPESPGVDAAGGPYGVDAMTSEIERLVTFANASANRIAEYLGAK